MMQICYRQLGFLCRNKIPVGGLCRRERRRVSETACSSNNSRARFEEYDGVETTEKAYGPLPVDERIRRKRAELYQRSRKKEPLEAELVVLFGSVAIILIIPWAIHDYRFIFILPAIVFAVPGLRGVVHQAGVEIFEFFAAEKSHLKTQRNPYQQREKKNSYEDRSDYETMRTSTRDVKGVEVPKGEDATRVLRGRRQREPIRHQASTTRHKRRTRTDDDDDAILRILKGIPVLRNWGGFL